jgi:hypothetical protein
MVRLDAPGERALAPTPARQGSRPRKRNDLIRRALLSLASPSGSGEPMSRQELAEALNAYLHNRGVTAFLSDHDIGRYERGETRWTRAHYRRALRTVLGAETDAQVGLFNTRPSLSNGEPFDTDEPGDLLGEPAGGRVNGATVAPPVSTPLVSRPAPPAPPVSQVRVVLHWTGRKAYALRVAMRLSIHDFAAKLGASLAAVRDWREDSTGSLRFETHRMLDTMLSLATDDDLLRFDLALREVGDTR